MDELLYKEESYRIVGACFEVYKEKGCGFLEGVYQECLEMEFAAQKIPFTSQPVLNLNYKGISLKHIYQPDFICYDKILIELKATEHIASEHKSQLLNYLHAGGYKLGLLINFGHHPKLECERIALTKKPARIL